jgi:hypothetical protein
MITTNYLQIWDTNGIIVYQGQILTVPDVAGEVAIFLAALVAGISIFFAILTYRKSKEALNAASE